MHFCSGNRCNLAPALTAALSRWLRLAARSYFLAANWGQVMTHVAQRLPDPGLLITIEPDRDRVERAVPVFQVVTDGRDFRVRVDGHNIKFCKSKVLAQPLRRL